MRCPYESLAQSEGRGYIGDLYCRKFLANQELDRFGTVGEIGLDQFYFLGFFIP